MAETAEIDKHIRWQAEICYLFSQSASIINIGRGLPHSSHSSERYIVTFVEILLDIRENALSVDEVWISLERDGEKWLHTRRLSYQDELASLSSFDLHFNKSSIMDKQKL